VLPSEIHHQICQVYGGNAITDSMVRKWFRMFNERRENAHDEARSGRPALMNDDWVRKFNERERDDTHFTISDLSLHFPQISRTVPHDIDGRIILRWIFGNWEGVETGWSWLRIGTDGGTCE